MKIGLVLEGGAMRGMFTTGVLDTFLDNNIIVDGVIGVSAGALFGVNYVSKQKGRALRYNKRFNGDKDYMGIKPLLKEGNIVSTQYAYDEVPTKLDPFDDKAYMESGIPFYAVVTNIKTGKPEYMLIQSVFRQMDTLRASGSMPFVSKPVEINKQYYLDGGISDSIPFVWMKKQGYDKLIVILTRDMSYRKEPMSKSLINLFYHKYPNLAKQMIERHKVYNESVELLSQWEKEGKAFVIRPSSPIEIGRIESDPDKLEEVYQLGVKDALNDLTSIKEYIS